MVMAISDNDMPKRCKNTEQRYSVELTASQLLLMANCVEDLHRFMAGQMELANTLVMIDNYPYPLCDKLNELKDLVVPELKNRGSSYDWTGKSCPNDRQRKFLATTYYLYREIYHQLAIDEGWNNVYSSSTLRCEDSGPVIKVKKLLTNNIK